MCNKKKLNSSVLQISLQVFLHPLAARTGKPGGFTGQMEHGFTVLTPGGAAELEGEDDVAGVADLTDESSLGAQIAVEHVTGGEIQQSEQEGSKLALRYLS